MKGMLANWKLLAAGIIPLIHSTHSFAVTFDELAKRDSDTYQIIDCRASEFYNGWPEQGEIRGGHFPSSVNFSANWLDILSDEQIRQQLNLRKLNTDKPTYLYCNSGSQNKVKTKLEELGFSEVAQVEQNISDYQGQLVSLPNYQQLVPASWVNELISGKAVNHAPEKGYKVVEVAWGPPVKYLASHIPGALYLNTNQIESEDRQWNRVSAEDLKTVLEELGIGHDTTVVLYGRNNMAAGRTANIFMYAGVKDVRLLDGGWSAWDRADYPTEALLNSAEKAVFGKPVPANPEYVIDIPEAKQLLADQENSSLVSIRTTAEYTGKESGYSYIKHKGRIKGSRWGHAGSDANHLEDFHNPDETMLSADIITRQWQEWNIRKDQRVAFYCGTGWRASEAFFYAHVMGWPQISVFDGGWFEWSNDESNPVESGEM
ncbi:sulfurtransferase [Vibrio sp. JC009]|uniref:rhodanese-like domain-containing protein n=1 Tax=Vibrio sp. JC009 TaxID=2912314 RepID=UPI0023B05EBA|nr:rhodanese-like domain-containing protein [Vibrio sp. JC009]WED24714.1 sulfurtransferase [Vibrio sp. JC009]